MDNIVLLYRKKTAQRKSIENVFRPIDSLEHISRLELPCDLHTPIDFFRLLCFGIKLKERNIHITGDVYYMAFILFWKRVTITVHDCTHYEDLKGMKKWFVGIVWHRLPMLFAKRIFIISPFVETQLARNFSFEKSKIVVIPNSFFSVKLKNKTKLDTCFTILMIGSNPHKNLDRLIEAVKEIDCQLLIVGRLTDTLDRKLNQYNIVYKNSYNLSREDLEECFRSCHLLFFASIKEGFGLPILEAQSCGTAVLTSNTASMPYVAGSGACLVNPLDVDEIREAILKIRNNNGYRDEIINEGFKNIDRFSENKFVTSYLSNFDEVFK